MESLEEPKAKLATEDTERTETQNDCGDTVMRISVIYVRSVAKGGVKDHK